MTPEEIQQQLLDAMQSMADMTKRQNEMIERSMPIQERRLTSDKSSLDAEKKYSEEMAKNYKKRLGAEEEFNPKFKKVLDNRANIEQRIIEQAKKKYGAEAFNETQRNKFFRDQIQKYSQGTTAYGGVITRFNDLNKQQQQQIVENAKSQQRLQEESDKFSSTVSTLVTANRSLAEAGGKIVVAAFAGTAKAAMSMGKAMLHGERGMSVGAKGITTLVNAIAPAVSAFGTLALAIGPLLTFLNPIAGIALTVVGGLSKLGASAAEVSAEFNEMAAALNDKLYAGFQDLGKMSMTGAAGMEGLANNLHKMGLTVAEFDKFKTVIANNAKEMKMFGATAEAGVNKFAEVSGELYRSEMGKALELMGIGAEEQYEHTAKYLALQARLGNTEEKNSKNLAKSTSKYIEELDRIAAITGVTRKEQEDAREAVMKIGELRAAILDEQAKKEAGDTGADARIKKLERGLDVATAYQQMGDARLARGAAERTAAGGPISEASAAFENLAQRQGLMKMIEEGGVSKGALISAVRSGYVEQAESVAGVSRIGGNLGPLGVDPVIAAETKAIDAEFKKRVAAEKTKLGDKFNEQDLIDIIAKERKATDNTTNKNVQANIALRESAITLDKAIIKYNEHVDINKTAIDTFRKAVDHFAKATGYKEPNPVVSMLEKNATAAEANAQAVVSDKSSTKQQRLEAGQKAFAARKAASEASAGERLGSNTASQSDLANLGLRINKKGDVQKSNSEINPNLINLAQLAQSSLPHFAYFTGFNDAHHQEKAPSSSHTRGLAMDFVLNKRPTPEEGKDIVNWLLKNGASSAIDEYNNPSKGATGPHIHAQIQARFGGSFSGPNSGYPVELHGRESVWPEHKLQSLVSSVKKDSIEEYKSTLLDKTSGTSSTSNDSPSVIIDLISMLSDKLDAVVSKLSDGNDIQDQLLKYSRV
jgi:hypothetical protein